MTRASMCVDGPTQKPLQAGAPSVSSQPPLFEAIRSRSVQHVKNLVSNGADVNDKNYMGYSPLHEALQVCSPSIVQCLVEAGANVRQPFPSDCETPQASGATPASYAAQITSTVKHSEIGRWRAIFNSLTAGQGENSSIWDEADAVGRYPLLCALERIEYNELTLQIIANCNNCNLRWASKWTPLHRAAAKGWPVVVDALVGRGADVELVNGNNQSALSTAMVYKQQDTAIVLLHAGAQIFPELSQDQLLQKLLDSTFYRLACAYVTKIGNVPINKLSQLVESIPVTQHQALPAVLNLYPDTDQAQSAIKECTQRAARDRKWKCLIHLSAKCNDLNSIKVCGTPVVQYVAKQGQHEVLQTLLTRMAGPASGVGAPDVKALATESLAALIISTPREGRGTPNVGQDVVKCALLLLNAGASVKFENKAVLPLHWAAGQADSEGLVQLLVSRGVGINVRDSDSCTALIVACRMQRWAAAQALVQAGADVFHKSYINDQSAAHWCIKHMGQETLKLLIDKGCDVEERSKSGHGLLAQCIICSNVPVVDTQSRHGTGRVHVEAAQGGYEPVVGRFINVANPVPRPRNRNRAMQARIGVNGNAQQRQFLNQLRRGPPQVNAGGWGRMVRPRNQWDRANQRNLPPRQFPPEPAGIAPPAAIAQRDVPGVNDEGRDLELEYYMNEFLPALENQRARQRGLLPVQGLPELVWPQQPYQRQSDDESAAGESSENEVDGPQE